MRRWLTATALSVGLAVGVAPVAMASYYNDDISGAVRNTALSTLAGYHTARVISVSEAEVSFGSAQTVGTDEAIHFFNTEWQATPRYLEEDIDDLKVTIRRGEEYGYDMTEYKQYLYNEEKFGVANVTNAIPVAERAVVNYYANISVAGGIVTATPKFSRVTVLSAALDQNGAPQVTIQVTDSVNGLVYTYTSSYPPVVQPIEPPDQPNPPATPKAFSKAYAPTIGGSTKVGKTLSAKVKTWSPKVTGKAWQWRRNGTAIAGATKSTYKLTAADLGRTITVVLTGSKSGYTSTAKQSKATKKIALGTLAKGKVKVTGTPKVGKTLTAKTSKWTAGVVYHYQWYRNSTALTGATAKTYILLATDSGKRFTVKVWTTKDGYKKSASRTSAKTGKVRA